MLGFESRNLNSALYTLYLTNKKDTMGRIRAAKIDIPEQKSLLNLKCVPNRLSKNVKSGHTLYASYLFILNA